MSETQVTSVLSSELGYEWGETAEGLLKFAEDLLDHVRHIINDWPQFMYDVCFGDGTVEDDCANLRRRCLEALGQIGRIQKELDDVQRAPDKELVESVAGAVLDVLTECRDFMAARLRDTFCSFHFDDFNLGLLWDSDCGCACKGLGQLTTMVNALEKIRSVMACSNPA